MLAYITRRTLIAGFTIWLISFLSFLIVQLPPGDYVDSYIEMIMAQRGFGSDIELLPPEEYEDMRRLFGLDKPLIRQYWDWSYKIVVHGDFGRSYGSRGITTSRRLSITKMVTDRVPATVALAAFTIVLTWTLAMPIGIYSAVRHHSIGDYTVTFLGFSGLAVPDFLLALVLMYLAFDLLDASVGGLYSGEYREAPWNLARVWDLIKHLFLPSFVLGTSGTASLIRIMRNNLLDELHKPYVVTARAKGLPNWKAVAKYPVRVAINPFISGMGYMLPALISGSIIVSVVMSLPTLGPMLLDALQDEDLPVAAAILLVLGAFTVVGTLISDILLVVVDPRIRLMGRALK